MPLGQKLEEARKRKGVSIREVSESTKIRGDYISAIEAGNFEINLPEVYLRGFVRLYAKFLGLDEDAMVADLDADLGKSVNLSSKKSLGSIVAQDHNEKQSKSFAQANSRSSPKSTSPAKNRFSLPIILSLVGVAITSVVVLLIYISSQQDDLQSHGNPPTSISEVPSEPKAVLRSQNQPISGSHLLSISISGNVAKLIVCDEGKKPPVFHEFDNLTSGWKQDIEFEGTFRCYSTQVENIIISVDGSTSQKIGGDRKGIGTFSWKPAE